MRVPNRLLAAVASGLAVAAVGAALAAGAPAPTPFPIAATPFPAPISALTRPSRALLKTVSDVSHPVVAWQRSNHAWGSGPRTVAGEGIVTAIPQGFLWHVLYGIDGASARYIVSLREQRPGIRYALDLEGLTHAPAVSPAARELLYAQVTWVREADGVLYVQNAHPTYAKSSTGRNAAITAIDLRTRKVLWRSPSLVANAQTFVLAPGNRLVTGYGFTREPDFVHVLDRTTGKVLDRLPVRDAPERITRSGNQIRVTTYTRSLVLRLRG
jgi:hypothetical protein